MAAQDLIITISARDQATEVLNKVRGEFDKTAGGNVHFATGINAVRESFEKLGAVIPGLTGSFRGLAGTMTQSVGGAATGLVSILASYGIALNRVSDEQLRFGRALNSLDVGTLRGELARVNNEMDRMSDIGNRIGNQAGTWTGAVQSFLSRLQALPQAAQETFFGAPTPEAQRAQAMTMLGGLLGVQEGARQTGLMAGIAGTQQRALLFQQQRRANEEDLAGFRALQGPLEAADRRERDLAMQALRQEQGIRRAAAIKEGLPTGPLEETFRLEQEARSGELAISLQRQKLAREEQGKALSEKLIDQRFTPLAAEQEAAQKTFEEEFALTAELQRQATQKADQAQEAADARLRSAQTFADFERETAEQQTALEKELDGQRTRAQASQLDVAVRRAEILHQQVGLTADERAQAQLVTIEAQRQLDLSRARSDSERELVELTARVQSRNVSQRESERTDPTAGMLAGFTDIAEQVASAGDRMRLSVVGAFHDINRGFSDIVVAGLTGEIDKIGDIGKQLGKRLLTSFIEQLSTGLTSRVFAALGQGLGLGGPGRVFSAIPLVASPFALGGGGGGVAITASGAASATAGGTLGAGVGASGFIGQRVSTGVSAVTGSSATGYMTDLLGAARQFGQGFFGPSVSAGNIATAFQLGGFNAVAAVQSGQAVIVATAAGPALVTNAGDLAAALGAGVGEAGASAAGVAGASGTLAGAGASAATIAGGVVAVAALAYSAYSAYQTADPYGGALSGALSGAVLGSYISPGWGTLIGAVAGAAIGGGAGMLGKAEQESKQRKQAEITRVSDAASAIIGQIRATASTEQLYALLAANGSGNSGGSSSVAIVTGVVIDGRQLLIGTSAAVYAIATLEQFVQGTLAGTFFSSIQQGIAQHFKDDANRAIEQAVTSKVQELAASEQGILFGYDEQFSTGLRGAAGRITRQTILPLSRLGEAAGQDLFAIGNTLDNLTDDQAQRILEKLVKVDRDRDLQILRVESDFGATVTIGHLTA
ncbi:MAG: glycine zipper domain-containing protein [Candidatus Rokubacteria bacterium]|nr:glycine zipper domain-containing protein [Candidatus Rokubacteria bacterium]